MLNVGALREGYVLDHIKAGKAMTIYHDLKLDKLDCTVAIINRAVLCTSYPQNDTRTRQSRRQVHRRSVTPALRCCRLHRHDDRSASVFF